MERENEFVGTVKYLEITDTEDRHGFMSVEFEYNDGAKAEMAVYGNIPVDVDVGSKVQVKGEISFGIGRYGEDEVYFDFYASEIKLKG